MNGSFITIHQPRRLVVGAGSSSQIGQWAANVQNTLVIASPQTRDFVENLNLKGNVAVFDQIVGEPDIAMLEAAVKAARETKPALIIGLGGGSALDVAKLVAALWDGSQGIHDVSGPNRVNRRSTLLAQVPTTAGTGSEAGIRSLITDRATGTKIAVESPHLIADIAVLDPVLTYSVPPAVTAATGIDAMAHCVEAFTNRRAHPMIDDYARKGFQLVGQYLERAVKNGQDTEAREGLMLASYYGGICLGPVNTAAGHAIAYPLGTLLNLPHGVANAVVFPHVLAFNQSACAEKTQEVAQALGLAAGLNQTELAKAAYLFCKNLGVEMSLKAHGATTEQLQQFATNAHAIRRLMDNNPKDMSLEDVHHIYQAAY
ncbi:iron-containing alcohol dehydrogenase [Brucellaceae bacterium C25G]